LDRRLGGHSSQRLRDTKGYAVSLEVSTSNEVTGGISQDLTPLWFLPHARFFRLVDFLPSYV
jgi:hypothetical protein